MNPKQFYDQLIASITDLGQAQSDADHVAADRVAEMVVMCEPITTGVLTLL